jgi:hypothetical protein
MFVSESRTHLLTGTVVAAIVLGVVLVSDANAWQQRPATPCPCAVDGSCQPNGPWGHTQTRWRPWPGDVVSEAPTPAEEAETREKLRLEPFELPPPEKENQRGPNTSKRPKAEKAAEGAPEAKDNQAPEPALPLPDLAPFEEAQPEGGLQIPKDLDLNRPAGDQPVEAVPPQPGIEQPPMPNEEKKPGEPQDDFDPFSQMDRPGGIPGQSKRRASLIPPEREDAPPELPPSLRKLSRSVPLTYRHQPRDGRYVNSAAMVQ